MKKLKFKLDISQVMEILLKALDHIDVRLVDHGHRVAYIVYKMMQASGAFQKRDMQEICIVAALHDIGAYKTEEIDNMMKFEWEEVFDHSIYGYLFFKNMSPLRKWAEVLLYHHVNYEMFRYLHYDYLDVSDMIHLADRLDLILQDESRLPDIKEFSSLQDRWFGRETIELFYEANERYDIVGQITNGSSLGELNDFISTLEYSDDTLLEFIRMIAYSIDFRSKFTVSHVVTTASISMELGKLFGLEEDELDKIQLGAYLHDIGKISTPLDILEKTGSLTCEEMEIMREHVNITGTILEGQIHEDIYHIAFRHHEKVDGTGYPNRLSEDQMTLSDQIVAVADNISALTGKRSYKEEYPKEMVIEILRRQMDEGKLSSRVIDYAIRHYDLIMETSRRNVHTIADMYESIRKEFDHIKLRLEGINERRNLHSYNLEYHHLRFDGGR